MISRGNSMERLIIKTLRLKGIAKDYEYSFLPGLNIIAGPISTGKTSILEFIDYCFGATNHPEHIEIQKKARSVLLESEINGEAFVIERPLFTSERKATIHECSLADIGKEHVSRVVLTSQKPGQESISSYLLNKLGLFNIFLREAPTKDASEVDMMSFRDLMCFCFMQYERLDNKELLFESAFMKKLKLQQVFDVVFKIHATELAQLSLQIKTLQSESSRLNGEIKTLTKFLNERKIPGRDKLEENLEILSKSEKELEEHLDSITQTLKGESNVAQQLRSQLSQIDDETRRLLVIRRDREKLLKRLLPLRGQYSEDTKKLQFLQEAKIVFDPLGLARCPYCLEIITEKNDEGKCSLCGKSIKTEPTESFDIKKEIRSIETKLKELNEFIQDTDRELDETNSSLKEKDRLAQNIQKLLDEAMKGYVSPYISERDAIVGKLNRARQQVQGIETQIDLHKGIEERINSRNKLEESLNVKETELETERQKVKSREDVINNISNRFSEILKLANFPKLENPEINSQLMPFVRGIEYRKIGSSGATTLMSLSWFLSIFESAVELGGSHPGFVLIDGPQKNIGLRASADDPEYRDTKIVDGLYHHIIEKASEYQNDSQWIIVDNEPPEIAEKFIAVKFTRSRDVPPYGLIDDEVE
jgi:DNA repair exonuclease SbcCD ATPase subunit